MIVRLLESTKDAFQSTPSRGGRRLWVTRIAFQSTFTPSRGGRPRGSRRVRIAGFQSTPSRGGRLAAPSEQVARHTFQSTPSRGGRHVVPSVWDRRICFSARATAKPDRFNPRPRAEGDDLQAGNASSALRFQSTPSRGGRRRSYVGPNQRGVFQSTPSRGGRHRRRVWPVWQFGFNPRPRAEGDKLGGRTPAVKFGVSIHALARRATKRPALRAEPS